MASNEIKVKIKVDDDGSLSLVQKKSKGAADAIDKVGSATEQTGKSAKTADRNLKGLSRQSANTTKNFSKMQQGMTGGLVPAYAILASNVFALSAAFQFFKRAADVKNLEASQIAFAQNTGIALGSITQRLREASDGMLGFQEAGQAAAIGLAKGFSPSQLEALAEGARKASTALGRDFQDSFDRLVRGASKAEPELLDELGITLRLEEATNRYAQAIGKNRNELNSFQRSQAVLIETQRQLNKNFGDVEAATNPFIKLGKTLGDIIKDVTQFFLPAFEGLAAILNKSAGAAIAAFGLLALSIIKTIVPMDTIEEKMEKIGNDAVTDMQKAEQAVNDYNDALKATAATAEQARAEGKSEVMSTAKKEYGGTKVKTLQAAMTGNMTKQHHNLLKESFKKAEQNTNKHGEVLKGIHKGKNIAVVRDLEQSYNKMMATEKTFVRSTTNNFKRLELSAKKSFAQISLIGKRTFLGLASVAKTAGKAMNTAFKFAGFIGMFVMIKDIVSGLINAPFTMVMAFAKGIDMTLSIFAKLVNGIARMWLGMTDLLINVLGDLFGPGFGKMANSFLTMVRDMISSYINFWLKGINKITSFINKLLPETKQISEISEFKFDKVTLLNEEEGQVSTLANDFEGLNDNLTVTEDLVKNSSFGRFLEGVEGRNKSIKASAEALKSFKEGVDKMSNSLGQSLASISAETDQLKKSKIAWNGLFSLDIPGQYEKINAKVSAYVRQQDGSMKRVTKFVMTDKDRAKALEELKTKLGDVAKISPEFGTALEQATLKGDAGLEKLAIRLRDAQANAQFFTEGIGQLSTSVIDSLGSGDIVTAIRNIEELEKAAQEGGEGMKGLTKDGTLLTDMLKQLREAFGEDYDTGEILARLKQEEEIRQQQIIDSKLLGGIQNEIGGYLKTNASLEKNISDQKFIQYQLSLNLGIAKETELNKTLRQLEVEEKILAIKAKQQLSSKVGSLTGSKTLGGAASMSADMELMEIRTKQQEAKFLADMAAAGDDEEGQAAFDTAAAGLEKVRKEMQLMKALQFGQTLRNLGEDFKALGPEGEYMGGMLTGLSTMVESWTIGMEQMKTASGDMSKTVQGALTIAGGMIQGLMQMQKASSDAKIKKIDDEIKAEKKRDGKSQASLNKIKELEKKKVQQQKKAFEQEKKLKIASTIINTAAAAVKAYELGPIIGPIMAAMIIAMGMKQLSIIKGTSFQGGGDLSDTAPTSVTAGKRKSSVDLAKSQSAAGELSYLRGASGIGGPENFQPAFYGRKNRAEGGRAGYVVGEQGPELFVPTGPGTIVPNDDVGAMGGATNVTFNINTIDAVGVEEVLTEQQGNIIGMIRSAANEYGDPFLEAVDTSIYSAPETSGYGPARRA